MEAAKYAAMLQDKSLFDLKKMQYKYSRSEVEEFLSLLKSTAYTELPIRDFAGNRLVYLESAVRVSMRAVKLLMLPRTEGGAFGLKAMEDEIHSSLTIENINSSRDSIRRILRGYAPDNDSEKHIFGLKKGLDFIANPENKISEKNLRKLYQLTVNEYLKADDKLAPESLYRHDNVFIVGGKVAHQGLPHLQLPLYMKELIAFINRKDEIHELIKAAILHFYLAYLHPYFDGNGRTARLLHLWYLVQQGYPSTLFVPFSSHINETRRQYYKAFAAVEENGDISGLIDITPFLVYFVENVYDKLSPNKPAPDTMERFQKALEEGLITAKERELWNFVLSAYGVGEFSTKQLERDFGNAAYATIRLFVQKFEKLGLLIGQRYVNKTKYHVG